MRATFVSALVTCIMNGPPEWTGCPLGGVMRTPMLVGTIRAYLQFFFNSMFMCDRYPWPKMPALAIQEKHSVRTETHLNSECQTLLTQSPTKFGPKNKPVRFT